MAYRQPVTRAGQRNLFSQLGSRMRTPAPPKLGGGPVQPPPAAVPPGQNLIQPFKATGPTPPQAPPPGGGGMEMMGDGGGLSPFTPAPAAPTGGFGSMAMAAMPAFKSAMGIPAGPKAAPAPEFSDPYEQAKQDRLRGRSPAPEMAGPPAASFLSAMNAQAAPAPPPPPPAAAPAFKGQATLAPFQPPAPAPAPQPKLQQMAQRLGGIGIRGGGGGFGGGFSAFA